MRAGESCSDGNGGEPRSRRVQREMDGNGDGEGTMKTGETLDRPQGGGGLALVS